jgi:O-antigen/teichoic acid export membrane protein
LFTIFSPSAPDGVAESSNSQQSIAFISDYPEKDRDLVFAQLSLDSCFNWSVIDGDFLDSDDLGKFSIIVVAGFPLNATGLNTLWGYCMNGGRIFWLPAANIDRAKDFAQQFGIISAESDQIHIKQQAAVPGITDPPLNYTVGIEWSSAPEITGYYAFASMNSSIVPILIDYKSGDLLVWSLVIGEGQLIFSNILYLESFNWDFQVWWYSPYYLYHTLQLMLGNVPESFITWQYSPIPQRSERTLIFMIGLFLLLFFGYILLKLFRKRGDHEKISMQTLAIPGNLNISRVNSPDSNKWEEVGLHRQISSFFLSLLTFLFFNLPYILLVVSVYYRYIQPFPMVQGALSWIGGIFGSLFLILEMEIGTALKKFFAEYRVQSMQKAVKYAQVYVWWQLLLNVGQAVLFLALTLWVFPTTFFGYLTFFWLCSSLARLPGVYGVIGLVMDGLQRFDLRVKLNAILGLVVNTIISYLCVLGGRWYYAQNARFGEAFGAAIGGFIGGIIAGAVDFLVYILIFRKLGYRTIDLFRPAFTRREISDSLAYGFKLSVGNAWRGIAGIVEMALISLFIYSYSAELGYYSVVGQLTGILGVLATFTGALMPAISEAHGNGKRKLTNYYLVSGLKWINFFVFFFMAVMFATGERFLLLTGSQWTGSLKYIGFQVFFGAFWPMAWYVDTVFQGTGHTGYNTFVWVLEQGLRVILLFLFLPRFGLWGLYYSYIPGIITKNIVGFVLIRKKISRFSLSFMQTTFVPLVSGICLYGMLFGITSFFSPEILWINALLFFGALLLGFIVYGFLTGLLGGWDSNTITEFQKGLAMTKSTHMFFRPLFIATSLGYRFSPVKDRFSLKEFSEAAVEAQELTQVKILHNNSQSK